MNATPRYNQILTTGTENIIKIGAPILQGIDSLKQRYQGLHKQHQGLIRQTSTKRVFISIEQTLYHCAYLGQLNTT